MTEQQGDEVISLLGDIHQDLANLQIAVEALDITSLSSSYAVTTTVGVSDVRLEHTASTGDLMVAFLLGLLIFIQLARMYFNGVRGLSV